MGPSIRPALRTTLVSFLPASLQPRIQAWLFSERWIDGGGEEEEEEDTGVERRRPVTPEEEDTGVERRRPVTPESLYFIPELRKPVRRSLSIEEVPHLGDMQDGSELCETI